ncbi:MAG: polysaccharide deacetylase family protein [Clostridia bacterium]|nr:polysaccharide deacetylase family protein [Clostridia bacterium]
MGKLLKRRNVSFITNAILTLVVAVVAAICFAPPFAVPASSPAPYYSGSREGQAVSLMFNVYEGEDIVCGILDELDSRGLKATFFMGGCFADDHADLLRRMADSGHEIGNHGYFHLDHAKISKERNLEEIENTGKVITALCGVTPTLFAPPSGSFSTTTVSVAESLGYSVILWSKDTIDWRDSDKQKIFRRATVNVKAGDLILMHPKQHTLEVLGEILDYYEQQGLKQSTVSANVFGE